MAGIGIPIADTALFVASKAVANMTNVVAERNERAKDALFAEKHGLSAYEYRSSEYERLGFDNLDDLHQFVEAMKGEGVTVASTYYKYNGQYLVEMPKTMENGTTSTELLANYERSTGYSVQNAKEEYHDTGSEITNAPAGFVREVFTRHIDGWNEMFGGVSSLWHWSEAYKFADETSGAEIFKRKANNDGEISMSAKVGANSQKAVVLNNETVVINGEIVKDEAIRADILRQHEERMKAVYEEKNYRDNFTERRHSNARESKAIHSGAVSYNDTANTVGRLTAKQQNMGLSEHESQELARAQQRLSEYEKYSGYDFSVTITQNSNGTYGYTYKNITDKDFRVYNETMLKSIEDSGYAIRARGGVFDAEAFKAIGTEELAKIGITPTVADTIVDVNTGMRKLNPRAELAERIKENAFRQEYSYEAHNPDPLKQTVFSHWSFGSLADITRELNETNVAFRVSNNEKLLNDFSQEELDIFHKQLQDAGVSESVLYTDKDYALEKLEHLYEMRLAWLDNRLAEIERLKAGIDTSTKKGQEQYAKLSQEERELRDKKADIAMHRNSAQDIVKALEIAWTSKDSVMIDARTKAILNDLTKSELFAGLNINLAKMDMNDLLKINKAFLDRATELNYKFIKVGKKFDIKALQSLSARELQEVFGISVHTRDMLVRINEKGSWGKTGGYSGMAYKGLMFIMQRDDSDETVAELYNIGKAFDYTKGTIQTIKRSKLINRKDLRHAKKEHSNPNKPNKEPKNKKHKEDAEKYRSRKLSEKERQRVKKYEEAMAKRYQKTEAKKQAGKLSKMYQQAQEKVAQSALGKAMTAISSAISTVLLWVAIIFLLIPLIIGLILAIFVFIYWGISSLLNIDPQAVIYNWLAPDVYEDTVAWNLYEFLQEQEEDWIDAIDDTSDIFENRATLKYGSMYRDYSEYLTTEPRIVEIANDDGTSTMYINPFRGVASAYANKSAMTKVEDYTGVERYDVLTNVNYYNRLDSDHSIESGHTSNIKDILSMTDVMFQYELDENDDATMEDILGMSPAQLNWTAFCEKVKNVFKWIGNGISKLFNPDREEPPYLIVNTFDYKTVQNYASTLFQVSHQNVLTLDVVFYDEDRKMYAVVNGVKTDITGTTFAEGYGFCSEPEKNDFKIRYVPNTGKISPYLQDTIGGYYYLDSGAFDVNIDMNDLSDTSTAPCLELSWGDDSATHGAIRGMSNLDEDEEEWAGGSGVGELFDDKCWTETKTETALTSTASDTNYSNARMRASMYASYLEGDDTYDLSDSMDSFQAIIYRPDGEFVSESSATYPIPTYDEEGNPVVDEEGNPVMDSYTIYTVTYRWGYKDTYTYSRSCQGHEFEYCGGHVCVHSQGIVYSTTNEQLTMAGEFAEGLAPCTPTFHEDKASMGYADLVGKVNTETVRYDDNVVTASTSGKAEHPLNHEQGSYAGVHGLNLWVVGEEWSEDSYGIDTSVSYPQYTKDIFDIDTAMRKGKRLFPLSHWSKYEGWTKDNMEFVILKMTNDWHDIYGFDIPIEVSNIEFDSPLSTLDIENIITALKNTYGTDFTPTREEAVRLALGWVNRGHFAEGHESHNFLSDYCESNEAYVTVHKADGTTEYRYTKGNCTASDDLDFVNYIYQKMGKSEYGRGSYTTTTLVSSDYSNVLPADVVSHKGIYNYSGGDIEIDVTEFVEDYGVGNPYSLFNYSNKEARLASARFAETQTTFFVGVLNEDVALSSGHDISAGVPIVLDMQRTKIGGAVTLHTRPISASYVEEILISGDEHLYYWIQYPDSRTSVYSFE